MTRARGVIAVAVSVVFACISTQKSNAQEDTAVAADLEDPIGIQRVSPEYPREAARRGLSGCNVISFEITAEGLADKYQILDSQPKGVFDKASLIAMNRWKFKQPKRPGRYAVELNYEVDSAVGPPPLCIKTPTYEQLNPSEADAS